MRLFSGECHLKRNVLSPLRNEVWLSSVAMDILQTNTNTISICIVLWKCAWTLPSHDVDVKITSYSHQELLEPENNAVGRNAGRGSSMFVLELVWSVGRPGRARSPNMIFNGPRSFSITPDRDYWSSATINI